MSMKFGDPVMNIAASDANPVKYGVFRRRIHRDVEYMTTDGSSHRTPAHNLVKTGINPAEKIDLLVKALAELRNEVKGCLGAYDHELRLAMGNTNVAVLHDRIANAEIALAAAGVRP